MLTKTYAFLSLSVEHARLHDLLTSVRKLLQISIANRHQLDVAMLKSVADQLAELDASCRTRKLERYLIPTIRKVTHAADSLIDDLEASSIARREILDSVRACGYRAREQETLEVFELNAAIEAYCNNLLERLKKEEKELLPLAQRVISSEIWFAMGAQFLTMDSVKSKHNIEDTTQDADEARFDLVHAWS